MPRTETKIFGPLPTATQKQHGRTQIFHGLPAPIQPSVRAARGLVIADFSGEDAPKTRLLPIEELLQSKAQATQAQPKGATSATAGWQAKPTSKRRRLRLLVGSMALLLAGYASLSDVRAATPAPGVRVEESALVVEPPPVAAAAPMAEAPKPRMPEGVAARAASRRAQRNAASPRKAGDQLAAGDLARAAKTYEQLSSSHPNDPVYAEAARILRMRVARPAP